MKKAILILWGITLALAVVVGCATDQPTVPTIHHPTFQPKTLRVIGPSEVVFAIDVSNAVSAEQLTAMVDAAKTTLSNAALVPADGSITVAVLVYGESVASPFAGLVPVTPENLTNVILPGLTGLETDRLVAGASADIAGAITAARNLLVVSPLSDRHLLIMAPGPIADAAAEEAACGEMATSHIMVSAITLGESAPLAACVASTGGFFAGPVTDVTAAAAQAFSFMLEVDLMLVGSATELPLGSEFTATATLFRAGDAVKYPLTRQDVDWKVLSGPNAGLHVTNQTDTTGVARFSFIGTGVGTDVVVGQAVHSGSGVVLSDTVRVTFVAAPPVCNAGGPYEAEVRGDTVRIILDGSGSTSPGGGTLQFAWSVNCVNAAFNDSTLAKPLLILTGDCLCAGNLTVTLRVTDASGTSTCEATITLHDLRPPVIVVRSEPLVLWPPNHRYSTFTPDMFITSATDACGRPIDVASAALVLEVRSDEADDARGSGRTANDIMITCPNTVQLRAERAGGGDGRVYTILYRFVVGDNAPMDIAVKVVVPHDQSSRQVHENPTGGFVVATDCLDP